MNDIVSVGDKIRKKDTGVFVYTPLLLCTCVYVRTCIGVSKKNEITLVCEV